MGSEPKSSVKLRAVIEEGSILSSLRSHSLSPVFLDLLTSLSALLLLVIVLTLASPHFLTLSNLANVTRQLAVLVIVSVGMTFVIISGGIDLSVGSVLALAGVVLGGLVARYEFTLPVAMLGAMIAGTLAGGLNGFLIGYARIPPFITTLGMYSAARGLALVYTNGLSISVRNPNLRFVAEGSLLGLPVPLLVAASVTGLGMYVLGRTVVGRYTYAIGGNEEAARLSGIDVRRLKLIIYGLGGLCAGIGSIIWTARIGSGQPIAGTFLELDAIAAVVIGGTSLSGGKGNLLGTVVGALIIGFIRNGLNLLNINAFWQMVVIGSVIVLAVFIDRLRERH